MWPTKWQFSTCLQTRVLQVLKLYYEAYLVGVADHGDVDVGVPAYLLLRDDNLGRESVLRVWHGVIKEANASNNLAYLADTIGGVRRVAINLKKVLLLHLLQCRICTLSGVIATI